jgi:hypothetical protein
VSRWDTPKFGQQGHFSQRRLESGLGNQVTGERGLAFAVPSGGGVSGDLEWDAGTALEWGAGNTISWG